MKPEDTEMEFVRVIRNSHLNSYGTLYGGWMMRWIVDAASAVAVRLARGPAVLGYLDDLHFLNPVYPGELAIYRARVEYTGNSSMGISVKVTAENPRTGEVRPSTFALLAYVAVDEKGKPRKLPRKVEPSDLGSEFYEEVKKRIKDRRKLANDVDVRGYDRIGSITVREEHLVYTDIMYAGNLLYLMDEVGSVVSLRHAKKPTVTACLDRMAFYTPIRRGDLLHFYAKITRVWRSSMEISVKTIVESIDGSLGHSTTSYMVFVAMGEKGPERIPPIDGGDPEADRRKELRKEIVRKIRALLEEEISR